MSAATCCYTGKPEAALNRLDHYRSLTPFDPYFRFFESFYTIACTFAGDYSRAAVVGRRAVEVRPGFTNGYKPLIAALGHLGRREEARHYLDSLLALQPGFSIRQFAETYPFRHTGDRDRYITGLRLAGTPER